MMCCRVRGCRLKDVNNSCLLKIVLAHLRKKRIIEFIGAANTTKENTMRLVKNKSFKYGKQSYSVEAMTEAEIDTITAALVEMGWKNECTFCMEDNGYDGEGFTMEFAVPCALEKEFKADFKIAKKKVGG